MIISVNVKDVKKGEYIHLKENENSPLWIRGEYDKGSKTYSLISYNDICREIFRKGTSKVFIEDYNY